MIFVDWFELLLNPMYSVKLEREAASGGKPVDMKDVMDGIQKKARDHSRRPMQVHHTS
jgi:hypothetical protein